MMRIRCTKFFINTSLGLFFVLGKCGKGWGESDRDRAASSAVKTHHGVAGCRRGEQERPDIDGLSAETGNCFRANVCECNGHGL